MDHERFAPLLHRIVFAGLVLGVLTVGLAFVRSGPAASPTSMAAAMIPTLLAVIFFLRIVLFFLSERVGPAFWTSVTVLLVLVLQAAFVLTPGSGTHTMAAMMARVIPFAYVLLVAVLVAAYTSHRLNHTYGLLATLFCLTAPPFLALPDTGVLPLALTFYWSSALFCIFLWSETGRVAWLVMTALSSGFATCGVVWGSQLFSYTLANGHAVAREASVTGVVGSMAQSILLVSSGDELLPATLLLGPAVLCFLPWAFRGKWRSEKRMLLAVASLMLLFAIAGGMLKTPGFVPMIPLLVALAMFGIHNLVMSVRRPAILIATIALSLVWNGATLWR